MYFFKVFLLNLTFEFVIKAEIIKIENKHTTAMFAAFQFVYCTHSMQDRYQFSTVKFSLHPLQRDIYYIPASSHLYTANWDRHYIKQVPDGKQTDHDDINLSDAPPEIEQSQDIKLPEKASKLTVSQTTPCILFG